MEAKDLMVGDWIKFPTGIDKIVDIIYVAGRGMCASFAASATLFPVEIDKLKPIPLTAEILKKNWFEKVLNEDGTECYRYYSSAADGYIKIILYNGGDGDWSIEIVNYEKFDDNKIVYNNNFIFLKVHQLQHALRLCGIDKEIEL